MYPSFNLVDEPYMPVAYYNGKTGTASLLELFTDERIVDIVVRPHERIADMRFLVNIALAACGIPANEQEWRDMQQQIPGMAAGYLAKWHDSFYLFHDTKPFLQIADLQVSSTAQNEEEESGYASTSKLCFHLASGNNSTLYDHYALDPDRHLDHATIARYLVPFQNYHLCGRIGSVQIDGTATERSSVDCPCAPCSMTHTLIMGYNLQESIWRNIPTADALHAYMKIGDGWEGRPVWEMFPRGKKDTKAVHNATQTLLGRLTPIGRAIRIMPDGRNMILGEFLQYPGFSNPRMPFPPEITATVVQGKKDLKLLAIDEERPIWRNLDAITASCLADGAGGCSALSHAASETIHGVDIWVGGMLRDKAAYKDEVESMFHLPGPMFQDEGHALFSDEIQRVDQVHTALKDAISFWKSLTGTSDACRHTASHDFLTAVEQEGLSILFGTIAALGTEDAPARQGTWRRYLRNCALDAYSDVCRSNITSQLRAFEAGRRKLYNAISNILEIGEAA